MNDTKPSVGNSPPSFFKVVGGTVLFLNIFAIAVGFILVFLETRWKSFKQKKEIKRGPPPIIR